MRKIRNYRRNADGNWQRCANRTLDYQTKMQRLIQMIGKHKGKTYSPLYPHYGESISGR